MDSLLVALLIVVLLNRIIFMVGRKMSVWRGPRGLNAIEKLMGLLLNLVAVNMMMGGSGNF